MIYIGLGSNLGERRQNLEKALTAIQETVGVRLCRISSVYETPALLSATAPPEWNQPYWNLVAEIETDRSPHELLKALQGIEKNLGRVRTEGQYWAPRLIDLDLLLFNHLALDESDLKVPHPRIQERSFVLDPLSELIPHQTLPDTLPTILELARKQKTHLPRLMGILNCTPDSFSNEGQRLNTETLPKILSEWDRIPLSIIDLGGESTRPGASFVGAEEEWKRLKAPLEIIQARYQKSLIRPQISIDTYKATTAKRALELGVQIINDVSGLSDPEMMEILQSSTCQILLMHSTAIPADPKQRIPNTESAPIQIKRWAESKLEQLDRVGISKTRVILDPGIGFGKTPVQSLELLKSLFVFQSLGCPLLIGHSRKPFMKDFSSYPPQDRDLETLGISFSLLLQGVDLLRIHDPVGHHRAFLSWNHSR